MKTGLKTSPFKQKADRQKKLIISVFASLFLFGIGFLIWFFILRLQQKTPSIKQITYDDGIKTMQSFTQTDCETLSTCKIGEDCTTDKYTLYLRDERDGKIYHVRRFMDNHCWMIDNLAYGGGIDGSSDYCASKTEETDPQYWREASSAESVSASAANGLNSPTTTEPVFIGNCVNPTRQDNFCSELNSNCGYLYNWAAATQDSFGYTGENSFYEGAVQGLCPTSWQLPRANGDSSFLALHFATGYHYDQKSGDIDGQEDFWQAKNQFNGVMSGVFNSQSRKNNSVSTVAVYWTSDQTDTNNAYANIITSDHVDPFDHFSKADYMAIRCLLVK